MRYHPQPLPPRRHRPSAGVLRLALLAGALLAAPVASAGTLDWSGVPGPATWIPPDETGTALADVPPLGYDPLSVFVLESGVYTLTSGPHPEQGSWPGLVALYSGGFDPAAPLDNLVAIDYYDETEDPAARIDAYLVEGVIYRVVTGFAAEGFFTFDHVNRLSGPGDVRLSACFPVGDEVDISDREADGYAVQENRFCVLADWATPRGSSGIGHRVPFRSDDSVLFWFFAPHNWELQVKVLDGCVVNGHFWVFFAATTNVEFELQVFGRGISNFGNPALQKTYVNPQGQRADAVTDTTAFPCSEVQDQL